MKNTRVILSSLLCMVILLSACFIPNMDFSVRAEEVITLLPEDFELVPVQDNGKDCVKVEGNTLSSLKDRQYPRIYINLNRNYYVKTIKITATVTGDVSYNSGSSNSAYISLDYSSDPSVSGNKITGLGWNYATFTANATSTKTSNISADFQTVAVNQVRSWAYWSKKPTADDQYKVTIDKIEIVESNLLKAQQIGIKNVTSSSVGLGVEINQGDAIDLRYSISPITEENFESASSLQLDANGEHILSGLNANTMYYFALKVSNGGKTGYSFTSAITYPESIVGSIEFDAADLTIQPISNSTVSGNAICSTTNKASSFKVNLPTFYNISGLKITAKTENNSLYTIDAGIQLFEGDNKVIELGYKTGFTDKYITTRYIKVDEAARSKSVDSIRIFAEWFNIPAEAGDSKLIIEKIEIIGKEALIPPKMAFINETGNSLDVSWASVDGAEYELWYSAARMSAENFETLTDKIMLYSGLETSFTVTGLVERNDYYFVLKVIRNGDIAYSSDRVTPLSLDSEWVILDEDDFTLKVISNCTVNDNTMSYTSSMYPKFYMDFNTDYLIKEIKITATVVGRNYTTLAKKITLRNADENTDIYSLPWNYANFNKDTTSTKSAVIPDEYQTSLVNQILFGGGWGSVSSLPSGEASITFEKIEIKGSRVINNANITYDKITGNSVNVNWTLPSDVGVKLWFSENELTEENFNSADKTLIDSGRISSATVNGLKKGQTYYFALEVINGKDTLMFFSSVKSEGPIYDFEKSMNLKDYAVKTRAGSNEFYRINGYNDTVIASIENNEQYSDFGNAFKMQIDESTKDRYPILLLYAPNWADFSGEGFSMTVGKTKNHLGENISVPLRVRVDVDGYGTFTTVKGKNWETTKTFPTDTTKHTVEFRWEEFFLETDNTKQMTSELSQHITNINIFFYIPVSRGSFSLYFDSIRVINPIHVVREVEEISFAKNIINLQEGLSTLQEPIFTPYNATENDLIWSTDTPDVVSIDKATGKVVAKKLGIANIYATAPNGVTSKYKVIVKEDARGTVYRELFCFDDGEIPKNVTLSNATAKIDYLKVDSGGSLYIKSNSKTDISFIVEDYEFYGEGIGIWACGDGGGKYIQLQLITSDNKIYSYSMMIDTDVGNFANINYSYFKLNGTGDVPTVQDIINFKKLRLLYDKSLYVDSIKVVEPKFYNLKQYPNNTIRNTKAEIEDSNKALKNLKYYFELIEIGSEYNWATNALIDAGLIGIANEAQIYSLYFVDDNFVQHDLKDYITVTLNIPQNFEGMNNIWILYIDDGKIQGVTAHISGNKISFEASKSGVYCMISGIDDDYLTKKIKTSTGIEIMTDSGTEDMIISKDIVTVKRKKTKDINKQVTTVRRMNPLIWWIIIPIIVLVAAAGTVTTVMIIMKRNKRKGEKV